LFIEDEYGHDAFLEGLASSKKSVDNFYAKNPDYRIVHDNLMDMSKVTSSHTYQKGSWILHKNYQHFFYWRQALLKKHRVHIRPQ